MDNFASESSIGGVSVFHSSESRKARIAWHFVYFLFFIILGFYVWHIYIKYKVEPEFSYKFSEFPLQEIPFPAVTICSPLFARNQSVNLQEFLKNPNKNLTKVQQNLLAANLQACAPEFGSKIDKFCPLANTRKTVEVLKSKYLNTDDAFDKSISRFGCAYSLLLTYCEYIINQVLTDFGFCFSFNLEAFETIFNTKIISKDFESYSRDGKLAKNYFRTHPDYQKYINESDQPIHWNLENGYLTNETETLPVRALYNKGLTLCNILYDSDLSNLCPKMGKSYSIFLHMPNEILTPFHQPLFVKKRATFYFVSKWYKTDESLRPYAPEKRNCYFQSERSLKFFKTYTKALCQFECLANFTLIKCGCVKFSMPREKSTRICGLKETSCYIRVAKNWNLTCGCLPSCTYIEYNVEQQFSSELEKKEIFLVKTFVTTKKNFGEKIEVFAVYNIYNAFADLGGMLSILFGASLISFIEIFYFLLIKLKNINSRTQENTIDHRSSRFSDSSTIHGVKFIFSKSQNKLIRFFWFFAFVFAFSCCLYDARENYWKLNVVPETQSKNSLIPTQKVPFPAITICSPLFAKGNLTENFFSFNYRFQKSRNVIKELNSEQFYYFIANLHWNSANLVHNYLRLRNKLIENITAENYRSGIELFPYVFGSHLETDELLFDCKFKRINFLCSKLFKKVMTFQGICYTFNMLNYHEIFKEGISKYFDSYGKFEPQQQNKLQWSLDEGFSTNSSNQHPVKASQHDILELRLRVPKSYVNTLVSHFYLNLPNDILTHVSTSKLYQLNTLTSVTITAKLKQTERKLQKFSALNRGCLFQNERKLKFFHNYTRSNCILECFTDFILKSCGCVSFLLPHVNSTNICESPKEMVCYSLTLKHFPPANESKIPCGCLKTCNDIEYSSIVEEKELKNAFENDNVIFFKFQLSGGSTLIEEEIRLAYGFGEFFTNVGGLLGLYLGCSVISVLEIFYFFCIFLYGKLRRRRNQVVPF